MGADPRRLAATCDCSTTVGQWRPVKNMPPTNEPRWISCVGCGGEVGIPNDWTEPTATCPKCGAEVACQSSVIQWRPAPVPTPNEPPIVESAPEPWGKPVVVPSWIFAAGWAAVLIGIAAFIASFNLGAGRHWTFEGGLTAGCLNPLFFIGLPLGIYWLHESQAGYFCPHCGKRHYWSQTEPRRYPKGSFAICWKCKYRYRVPSRV
jgi:endogenous inhibitor of DNA gyrase (YacG/DUF329 family)